MIKQLKREMEKVDLMPENVKGIFLDFYDYLMNTENLGERRIIFHMLQMRNCRKRLG